MAGSRYAQCMINFHETNLRILVTIQEMTNQTNRMKRELNPPTNCKNVRTDCASWLKGHHLQKDIRSWLSPPDPSKNHNIAHAAQHDGTAEWFIHGSTFDKWITTGSLLWIHGKRMSFSHSSPSLAVFNFSRPNKLVAGSGKTILSYVLSQACGFTACSRSQLARL